MLIYVYIYTYTRPYCALIILENRRGENEISRARTRAGEIGKEPDTTRIETGLLLRPALTLSDVSTRFSAPFAPARVPAAYALFDYKIRISTSVSDGRHAFRVYKNVVITARRTRFNASGNINNKNTIIVVVL